MNFRKIILILTLFFAGIYSSVNGETLPAGDFVVFTSYTGNPVYDEIINSAESAILDTCAEAGRLIPVEYNYKKAAIKKSEGADRENLYLNSALYLKADIYAVITSYDENGDYVLKLDLIPLNDKYKGLKSVKILRSRIPENLPLKSAYEFAGILKNLTLKSNVIKVQDDGAAIVNSGQWHGLEAGDYSTDAGKITIKNVSRYTSVVRGINFKEGQNLEFKILPDIDKYRKKINYRITENTVRVYGTDEILDKRDGSVKDSIQGTCIINQGANFCLPGYGSFLSVEYMGVANGKPDYAGVFIASSLTAVHIGLVPVLTDFKVMFFPWMDDPGRTERMQRLNYFTWGTIPLTFTASFFSQLAYNYKEKNLLPPVFADRNTSAAVVSLFVPGGGMFYKGYRWTGWGVYLGELSLAGYAVYTDDRSERALLLGSLAMFKCAEILVSYFIPPSYSFFNREVSSIDDADFSIGLSRNYAGDGELTASVSCRY